MPKLSQISDAFEQEYVADAIRGMIFTVHVSGQTPTCLPRLMVCQDGVIFVAGKKQLIVKNQLDRLG